MKNIGTLYQDKKGTIWIIKKETLSKKRGTYVYWVADEVFDIKTGKNCHRGDNKRDLIKTIKESL